MVNWQDPSTIEQNYASLAILCYVAGGIYFWEWTTTLYFDWKILSSDRTSFKLVNLIYVVGRIAALGAVICGFITLNVKSKIDCFGLVRSSVVFGYIAMALSSALIAIRIIAIWNHKRLIELFVGFTFLVNVGCLLYGTVTDGSTEWSPTYGACLPLHTEQYKMNAFVSFTADVSMLTVMLVGIWINAGTGSLSSLVYRQGLIWFVVAVLFYIPSVVLFVLDLNAPMNMLFQTPLYVAMTISATRMYRGLHEYANPSQFAVNVSHSSKSHNTLHASQHGTGTSHRNLISLIEITRTEESDRPISEEV